MPNNLGKIENLVTDENEKKNSVIAWMVPKMMVQIRDVIVVFL